jgi:hypothetical protein
LTRLASFVSNRIRSDFSKICADKGHVLINMDRCYDFVNIFAKKNLAFFYSKQSMQSMQKNDHNIVFFCEKRRFFVENCRKSQKIVSITSTPGRRFHAWALNFVHTNIPGYEIMYVGIKSCTCKDILLLGIKPFN